MNKTRNNRAWLLVLPVFALVAFSAIVPLMTVVNYSVQDIFGPEDRVFVGAEWYREILQDDRLRQALLRQFVFSFTILVIEIPLGIAVALAARREPRSILFGSCPDNEADDAEVFGLVVAILRGATTRIGHVRLLSSSEVVPVLLLRRLCGRTA